MNILSSACLVSGCIAVVFGAFVLRIDARAALNRLAAGVALCYAAWAIASSFVDPTVPVSENVPLRVGLFFYVVTQFFNFWTTATVAQVRGRWRLALLLPLVVVSSIEGARILTGEWIIGGYVVGPHGPVSTLTHHRFWLALNLAKGVYARFVGGGLLAWAWWKSPSRRFRAILLQFFVFAALTGVCVWFCTTVVWLTWGYRDPTVAVSGVGILILYNLVARYDFLRRDRAGIEGQKFRSLRDFALLVDAEGRVAWAGERMARLISGSQEKLKGRALAEVLRGWSELPRLWKEIARDHAPRAGLPGSLGSRRFLLTITPEIDRFGDLEGALVRLQPVNRLDVTARLYGLSAREQEVADRLLDGFGVREIADALFISPATVKNHLHSLYRKTQTANRVRLVRLLMSDGSPAG